MGEMTKLSYLKAGLDNPTPETSFQELPLDAFESPDSPWLTKDEAVFQYYRDRRELIIEPARSGFYWCFCYRDFLECSNGSDKQ